jgi:hypothetical protein
MADEKDEAQAEGKEGKGRTTVSLMREMVDAVREASDDKIEFVKERLEAEAVERDKRSETLYKISQERAEDMQEALASKDRIIRFQWAIIALLVIAVIGLAGYRVAGNLFGIGEVDIGGGPVKVEAPAEE